MEVILKNKLMEVRIESKGAELTGMKDLTSGVEYIWQKNPEFWGKSSPVLFPFVGALKDERYIYEGKEYKLNLRHGFARDNEFLITGEGDGYVEFLFTSNEETRKIYPFDFKLYIKYILEGRELKIEYTVENLTDGEIYFSLGAHPAFNTPVSETVDFSDYYIEFEKEETGEVNVLNGVLISSAGKVKAFDGKVIELSKDKFKNDALIVENPNSNVLWLKNRKNSYKLKFDYEGFKYIAFWNKPGAEFLCLEPWNGISDFDNASGNLKEKIGIEKLEKGKKYKRELKITIF